MNCWNIYSIVMIDDSFSNFSTKSVFSHEYDTIDETWFQFYTSDATTDNNIQTRTANGKIGTGFLGCKKNNFY